MTISEMPTVDFSFNAREVLTFLALARKNEETYSTSGKDPKKEAYLRSLRFKGHKIKHSVAAVSTDPALVMVIVTLKGKEECLIAFDSTTGKLLDMATHFTDSPDEWESEMCYSAPNVLASRFS